MDGASVAIETTVSDNPNAMAARSLSEGSLLDNFRMVVGPGS